MAITHDEILKRFYDWNPEVASKIINHKPWGSTSIVIWLNNGLSYKVKLHDSGNFTMQVVSKEDINKKFGLNK